MNKKYKPKINMELKTLKDIHILSEHRLKQEAILWVKNGYYGKLGIIWGEEIDKWIKHFFNLTEEDLKNE